MWCKRISRFWKIGFLVISASLIFCMTGCTEDKEKQIGEIEIQEETTKSIQEDSEKAKHIIEICCDLYKEAAENQMFDDLETIRCIVNQFGKNGYAAIDSKNQINMTCIDQVMDFCEIVDTKKKGDLAIIEVTYQGGFVIYELQTEEGIVNVLRNHYSYKNGNMEKMATENYQASSWEYTSDGYLMFSGSWFSEELYALTLSAAEEYRAFRVQPLDETCRELNRKYLLPISYEYNNMFLIDWNENDFGELDFYDLYDIFYPQINERMFPYIPDDNVDVGAVYQIKKEDFECVIMTYFNIDSETLQSKTVYDPEKQVYEYRPRGFYEIEYPEYPYPEVIGYVENDDGTITLTVQVVFPYEGISKVYIHEVTVRLLENGTVQYVSNHIIPSEHNYEETWYTPRLTEEEWERIYKEFS